MIEDLPDGAGIFVKRPVAITAVQLTNDNLVAVCEWAHGTSPLMAGTTAVDLAGFDVLTDEGVMRATVGDWIIRGIEGEFYPCRDSVFRASYEAMTEEHL